MLNFADRDDALVQQFTQPLTITEVQAEAMLHDVGGKLVAWLQSYTGETSPGLRKGDPPRPNHPGKWADRTGELKSSYRYEVTRQGGILTLTIVNDAPHARWVDRMDGRWVLALLFETPDALSILQNALLKHLR